MQIVHQIGKQISWCQSISPFGINYAPGALGHWSFSSSSYSGIILVSKLNLALLVSKSSCGFSRSLTKEGFDAQRSMTLRSKDTGSVTSSILRYLQGLVADAGTSHQALLTVGRKDWHRNILGLIHKTQNARGMWKLLEETTIANCRIKMRMLPYRGSPQCNFKQTIFDAVYQG